jgi:nucleobase:cation symporter-1, NCS1 family
MTTPPVSTHSRIESSPLYNPDLAPTNSAHRTWGTYNYAALWVSMSVNILTYMLAASLIQGGMNWKQAVATVFLGNTIVLAPMLLNSHPGARYGVPFPVLARASFGVLGANVAAVLRALVACGWFGIQTWIGGEAFSTLIATLVPGWGRVPHSTAICFLAFWFINLAVILKGIEYIRFLQGVSAPILLAVGLLLLAWAYRGAGGFGPMLSAPSKFSSFPDFLKFLVPALNATVGFWATVSLNIPDFTRFARSQRQQAIGQALALPTTMTLYSLIGILLATLNVNIGANVVSPANDFSNLWPRKISFRIGGVITCFVGIALMPWKLLADYKTFILGWLGGYAAFLGPVAGIMICDYFLVRGRVLVVEDLYLRDGAYEYWHGFNWSALLALGAGAGTALVGLVVPALRPLYDYSWFVGFIVSFTFYFALMKVQTQPAQPVREPS